MKRQPHPTRAELAHELHQTLCRLAVVRDDALRCDISACRRARICMGDDLRCIYRPFDPKRPMRDDQARAWNELARRRARCLAALRRP